MKPVRGKGTHRLKTEMRKEMWASHQITAFQVLGKEKALTGFPPTLVWFYLINWMYCPWMVFSDAGLHHALSSFFTSLHYSTYCLGRLATLCDIVRQVSGAIRARQETTGYLAGVISIPFKANCSVTGENH